MEQYDGSTTAICHATPATSNEPLAVSRDGRTTAAVSIANVTATIWMHELTAVSISSALPEFVAFAIFISSLTDSARY
jgi:hypothetical protein